MVTRGYELEDLVGEELGGVCFVRDYVELHFDGPILRALSSPTVACGSESAVFPDAPSRELLCRLIGTEVTGAVVRPLVLRIEFSGGAGVVEIPRMSRGLLPEVAHLVPERDGRLDVASMAIWESLD
jgi:hypothetical protein